MEKLNETMHPSASVRGGVNRVKRNHPWPVGVDSSELHLAAMPITAAEELVDRERTAANHPSRAGVKGDDRLQLVAVS